MCEQNDSLTQRGFKVAPSPFNEVKFDLGIILVIGVLLLLIQSRITDRLDWQLLLLLGYGLLGMLWIIFRTRRVMARLSRREDDTDGSQ